MTGKGFIFSLAAILAISSATLSATIGGQTGAFLRLPLSYDDARLAYTYIASCKPQTAFLYNPSEILNTENLFFSGHTSLLSLERRLFGFSTGYNIRGDAAVGLALVSAGVSDVDERTRSGVKIGEVQNGEFACIFTFSKKVIRDMAVGGNMKYVQSSIENVTAYGVGFDIGFYYRFLKRQLAFGAVLKNIDVKQSWDSSPYYGRGICSTESLPLTAAAGVGLFPKDIPLSILFNVEGNSYCFNWGGGVEYSLFDMVSLGAGYSSRGFGAGIGAKTSFGRFSGEVGYGYFQRKNDPEGSHILSFSFGLK
ncbi:MAG: hypothetical protein B6D65_03375 [candidate division Zixibacteria bacterium 4484_93]|nr:MAG: hypothetical protein B6D65_03375 [candidate division Zixibacteria bacterium 4484_93]